MSEIEVCGGAMGGYGTYEDLPKDRAVVEFIVPASMVSGFSINDMNARPWREVFAEELLQQE